MGLKEYQQKRNFAQTGEPRGKRRKSAARNIFVVQKHAASRLHYDLRLEVDGMLASWAVPKGPSLDPKEKRLAVQVEDHPLDYAEFEGTIPKGEYGGGTVMVWDFGHWVPETEARQGLQQGKLVFSLEGKKLRGKWALVRMQPRGGRNDDGNKSNWLLIKERDATARPASKGEIVDELTESAKTGRTLEEIAAGQSRRKATANSTRTKTAARSGSAANGARRSGRKGSKNTARAANESQAPAVKLVSRLADARRQKLPGFVEPELATLVRAAPEGDRWLHELKFDGYRMLCRIAKGGVRFLSRRGNDWTARLRDLAGWVKKLPIREGMIDGEVVVLDDQGLSSFQLLQNAFQKPTQRPLVYCVFDLIHCEGFDLREAPLAERKNLLAAVLRAAPAEVSRRIRFSDHVIGRGADFYDEVCKSGLEGIISKRRQSKYVSGRTADWVKTKCRQGQELVIVGFTDPGGGRTGFGALLVGYYRPDGQLEYAGRVGTGFDQRTLSQLSSRLRRIEVSKPPFAKRLRGGQARGVHFVKPQLVGQFEFSNWTDDGLVRHASFLGLREDKDPRQVGREQPLASPPARRKRAKRRAKK